MKANGRHGRCLRPRTRPRCPSTAAAAADPRRRDARRVNAAQIDGYHPIVILPGSISRLRCPRRPTTQRFCYHLFTFFSESHVRAGLKLTAVRMGRKDCIATWTWVRCQMPVRFPAWLLNDLCLDDRCS